jgi:hypothetical protein
MSSALDDAMLQVEMRFIGRCQNQNDQMRKSERGRSKSRVCGHAFEVYIVAATNFALVGVEPEPDREQAS